MGLPEQVRRLCSGLFCRPAAVGGGVVLGEETPALNCAWMGRSPLQLDAGSLYARPHCLECSHALNPIHLTHYPSAFKTQEDRQVSQEACPPLLRGIGVGALNTTLSTSQGIPHSPLPTLPLRPGSRPKGCLSEPGPWISAAKSWGWDSVRH